MAESQRPADLLLLSCPRTLSNLLVKLLSEQTGWEQSGYYLHEAYHFALRNFDDEDDESLKNKFEKYQGLLHHGYKKLLAARDGAHERSHLSQVFRPNKFFPDIRNKPYASDLDLEPPADDGSTPSSTRTNPTMLTDEMLLSFVPVFITRHPVLVVDSLHRAWGDEAPVHDLGKARLTGQRLSRELYTWYQEASSSSSTSKSPQSHRQSPGCPLIIDADDVLEGDTVPRLAAAVGMDSAQIVRSWETRSTTELDPQPRRFVQGLYESTGIDTSRTSRGIDVDARFEAWDDKYGEEVGKRLRDITNDLMEDYMWLKSRKF